MHENSDRPPKPVKRLSTWVLQTLAVVLAVLALWTLLPQGEKSNGIGYRSHCPFAPTSTLMLAIPAALLWYLAGHRDLDEDE